MIWGGGFDDFAICVLDSSPSEEIERALRFGWYLIRVEGSVEFSAQDIAELFQRAHISKPNVTRLSRKLANNRSTFRGSSIDRFRLTAAALAEFDEEFRGALDGSETPESKFASRLEEHLGRLGDQHVRKFVGEAVGCLRSGYWRAAIVLSWIGAVAILQNYVAARRLFEFNGDAKANGLVKRDARDVNDFAKIREADFLDVLERIGVVSSAVKKELKICLDRRNNCGHPNDYAPTEAVVAAHIETLLEHVFLRY